MNIFCSCAVVFDFEELLLLISSDCLNVYMFVGCRFFTHSQRSSQMAYLASHVYGDVSWDLIPALSGVVYFKCMAADSQEFVFHKQQACLINGKVYTQLKYFF